MTAKVYIAMTVGCEAAMLVAPPALAAKFSVVVFVTAVTTASASASSDPMPVMFSVAAMFSRRRPRLPAETLTFAVSCTESGRLAKNTASIAAAATSLRLLRPTRMSGMETGKSIK